MARPPPQSPGLLTDAELSEHLLVSRRQIGSYVQAGMPHEIGPRGKRRFRLDVCREWVARNAPEPVRGGKAPHEKAREAAAVRTPRRSQTEIDDEMRRVRGLVDRSDPAEIAAATRGASEPQDVLSLAAVRVLREGLQAEREAISLRQERGELVAAASVRAAIMGALSALALKLEELPVRLAHAAVVAAGVRPDLEGHVRAAMEREIGDLLEDLERLEIRR